MVDKDQEQYRRLSQSGVVVVHDTTSFLNTKLLEESDNFVPAKDGSIEVRRGLTPVGDTGDDQRWFFIDIKEVIVSGQSFLLGIDNAGALRAIFPDLMPNDSGKQVFNVCRYRFGYQEVLTCSTIEAVDEISIPSKGKIINTNKHIYVITTEKCWAINKTGRLHIDKDLRELTVDAFDATIYDLDTKTLDRAKTNEMGSLLNRNDIIYGRYRSELGGRGRPTQQERIHNVSNYVFHVTDMLYKKVSGSVFKWSNKGFIGKYPISYHDSKIALQGNTIENKDDYLNYMIGYSDYHYDIYHKFWRSEIFSENLGLAMFLTIAGDEDLVFIPLNDLGEELSAEDEIVVTGSDVNSSLTNYKKTTITDATKNSFKINPAGFDPSPVASVSKFYAPKISATLSDTSTVDLYTALLWQREDGRCFVTVPDVDFSKPTSDGTYNLSDMFSNALEEGEQDVILYRRVEDPDSEDEELSNTEAMKIVEEYTPSPENGTTQTGMYCKIFQTSTEEHIAFFQKTNDLLNCLGTIDIFELESDFDEDLNFKVFEVYCSPEKRPNGYMGGSFINRYQREGDATSHYGSWHPNKIIPISIAFRLEDTNDSWKDYSEFAPVYMISKPFGIENPPEEWTLTSTHSDDAEAPSGINQWSERESKYNIIPNLTLDIHGDPYLTPHIYEEGVGGDPDTIDLLPVGLNEFLAYGEYESSVKTFPTGFLEIYQQSMQEESDFLIGEQTTELHTNYNSSTGVVDTNHDDARYPVLIQKKSIFSALSSNIYTESIGNFSSAEYYNDMIWVCDGNVLRGANMLLEHNLEDVVELPAYAYDLKSTNSLLFIFTDTGVYAMNPERHVLKISEHRVTVSTVYGDSLFFATEDGYVYTMTYISRLNESRYGTGMRVNDITNTLQRKRVQWTVLDMKIVKSNLYVVTTKGLFLFDIEQQSWWRLTYENTDILKLVRYRDELYTIAGSFDYITPYEATGPA